MKIHQKKQTLLVWIFGFTVLFSMMDFFNGFIIYFILPLMFFVVFFKHPRILKEKYIILYGLLVIWMLVAMRFARSYEAARNAITIEVACLPCSIVCYYLARIDKNRKSIYAILILYLLEMLFYLVFTEGGSVATSNDERRNSELVNSNTLGYFSFYATFALFIICKLRNMDKKRTLYGLIVAAGISLYIALITASRQVLLVNFPLIAVLLICLYKKELKKNPRAVFGPVLLLALFIPIFLNLYEGSFLAERAKSDLAEDNRYEFLILAAVLGWQNPIFGVGPGNFKLFNDWGAFSHCTYAELLACCGFPALFLYLAVLISFSYSQFKRYKKYKDEMYLYFFVFSLFFIFDNFFFVFTDCLPLMEFFFFILGHSEFYYRENHRNLTSKRFCVI